jgi:hypothetical protein
LPEINGFSSVSRWAAVGAERCVAVATFEVAAGIAALQQDNNKADEITKA